MCRCDRVEGLKDCNKTMYYLDDKGSCTEIYLPNDEQINTNYKEGKCTDVCFTELKDTRDNWRPRYLKDGDCETNSKCCKVNTYRQPQHPPGSPPLIKLEPEDKNPNEFLVDIQKAYNNPESNGVFVSMIYMEGLDGSGSVLHKNTYPGVLGELCSFGFIWDTNWLEYTELVECLFPDDAATNLFNSTDCILDDPTSSPNTNFCKFSNTGSINKSNRCARGIAHTYYHPLYYRGERPYPTNCKQNIKYDLEKLERIPLEDNKNCFTYINDIISTGGGSVGNALFNFNEGVFLKDVKDSIKNFNDGFEKLKSSKKPLPSALLFLYNNNVDCATNKDYNDVLKILKSYFTCDTIVITANYNHGNNVINYFDEVKSLKDMPGYDRIKT